MASNSSSSNNNSGGGNERVPLIGVLALQGAFEEHQACLEAVGCRTVQVRKKKRELITGAGPNGWGRE